MADLDPADFDGDFALDIEVMALDADVPVSPSMLPTMLIPASGLYGFVRTARMPMHPARMADADAEDAADLAGGAIYDDDINALTLYTREELRLDVDGRYPQMAVSGTRTGPLGLVASWAAALTQTGPDSYGGPIWFKDGNVQAIPHNFVSLTVSRSLLSAQRKVELIFSGGGAVSFTRGYGFSSPHFRPCELEYGVVEGATCITEIRTHDHPNRPAALADETLSLETVFRRAGFNVTPSPHGGAIPLDAMGADQRWTDQELHDAMQIHWAQAKDSPPWSLWVLFAALHVQGDSLGGILFDDVGPDHHQGTAIFTDAFLAHPPAGDGHPAAWTKRMRFWTAAHEMGHVFNQMGRRNIGGLSSWLPTSRDPQARSFTTYPYAVAGGQAAFFADFAFRFSDPELLFMRHAPERTLSVGKADWFDDHGFGQAAVDRNEEFTLSLSTAARDDRLPYLLPPVVEMALGNVSGRPKLVSAARLSERDGLTLIIKKDGRPARQWMPYSRHRGESLEIILGSGEALYDSLLVGAGRNGWDMAEPGRYTVQAMLMVDGRAVLSNALVIKVAPPLHRDEEVLAQDLCTAQVGQVLAINGTRAVGAVSDILHAATRMKHHPLARQAAVALAGPLADEYKLLKVHDRAKAGDAPAQAARRVEVYPPDLKEARHLLAIAMDGGADAAVHAVGHTRFLRQASKLARALDGGLAPAIRDAALAFDAVRSADATRGFGFSQDMQRCLAVKANGLSI